MEKSAGIILHTGSPRLYLLLHYPGGHWDFPKGHLERGETERGAATRELAEETGISDIHFNVFSQAYEYTYPRDHTHIKKSVILFLAETTSNQVTLSHEHKDFLWLPFEQAVDKLTFPAPKQILAAAEASLR